MNVRWILSAAVAGLMLAGCGSSEPTKNPTVNERFAHAKELYDKGDYLEAINEFTVITLQYQGSQPAADAQYYLGECHFQRGEYLQAAFEYGVVKRAYPASTRVPDAQYKIAMSYYMRSPSSALDQQYTRKAIDEFQSFVEYYPSNPLAVEASAKIKELNTKLARKLYDAARQYVVLERYKAALSYFTDVIEQYHDTDIAPLAFLDKVELLIERKRYMDASSDLDKFLRRYPNSVLRSRAEKLQERLSGLPKINVLPTPVTADTTTSSTSRER